MLLADTIQTDEPLMQGPCPTQSSEQENAEQDGVPRDCEAIAIRFRGAFETWDRRKRASVRNSAIGSREVRRRPLPRREISSLGEVKRGSRERQVKSCKRSQPLLAAALALIVFRTPPGSFLRLWIWPANRSVWPSVVSGGQDRAALAAKLDQRPLFVNSRLLSCIQGIFPAEHCFTIRCLGRGSALR